MTDIYKPRFTNDLVAEQYKAIGKVNIPKNLATNGGDEPSGDASNRKDEDGEVGLGSPSFASPTYTRAKPHERIWLQWRDGKQFTWLDAKLREDDVEYVRAEAAPTHTREELVEVIALSIAGYSKCETAGRHDIKRAEGIIDALIALGAVRVK